MIGKFISKIIRYKNLLIISLGVLLLAVILWLSIQEVRSSASKADSNPFSQQIAALEKDLETAESDAERRDIQERLDFVWGNDWIMDWGKQQIKVSAGADADDYEQGAVVVIVYQQGDDVLYGPGKYLTPSKAGPVRIVDYEGHRLKLMVDDGTVYYFDALGRVFTKS
jgi:hypothetical protein